MVYIQQENICTVCLLIFLKLGLLVSIVYLFDGFVKLDIKLGRLAIILWSFLIELDSFVFTDFHLLCENKSTIRLINTGVDSFPFYLVILSAFIYLNSFPTYRKGCINSTG
jgi:hypothetical protein